MTGHRVTGRLMVGIGLAMTARRVIVRKGIVRRTVVVVRKVIVRLLVAVVRLLVVVVRRVIVRRMVAVVRREIVRHMVVVVRKGIARLLVETGRLAVLTAMGLRDGVSAIVRRVIVPRLVEIGLGLSRVAIRAIVPMARRSLVAATGPVVENGKIGGLVQVATPGHPVVVHRLAAVRDVLPIDRFANVRKDELVTLLL